MEFVCGKKAQCKTYQAVEHCEDADDGERRSVQPQPELDHAGQEEDEDVGVQRPQPVGYESHQRSTDTHREAQECRGAKSIIQLPSSSFRVDPLTLRS